MSVEDLDEWGGEVSVLDLVDGRDGAVVHGGHGLAVGVKLLEDLHLVVVELLSGLFVFLLEELLHLLDEESLGNIEEALLGTNDLGVVELVVVGHGLLVLSPLLVLALVDVVGALNDDILEFLEKDEDLTLDLGVVVWSLIGVELLGQVRDLSPEVVLLLRELEGDDLSSIGAGLHDLLLVGNSLQLDGATNEFDAFAEGVGGHGEGVLGSSSSEVEVLLLALLEISDVVKDLLGP